jgi:hypothetical protein
MDEITEFDREYTAKVNMFGFAFLAVHLPVLCGVALLTHASPLVAALICLVLLAGPAGLLLRDRSSSLAAIAIAIAAVGVSTLAIHVCHGMIEAHFELFVLIAMLTVFGRLAPLLVAGATIALHHVLFWLWLPASVFNYQASFSIVLLHAFFVILEVIPACWIAQQFGKAIRAQGIVSEQLGEAAEQVTASSVEIGEASNRLAHSASKQAATIEETSASSVEMSENSRRNAEASDSALSLMTTMDEQLAHANTDLRTMEAVVKDMVVSSKTISKVVKLIDGIAFQTSILSLNAAVEAAAAGESGAGFSVVAKEVGNLAQKSATAATDTAGLIDITLRSTQTGDAAVKALGAAMSRVIDTAALVKSQIALLKDASHNQNMAGGLIKRSLLDLGNSAQENAATAEQSAAVGACLTEQATALRNIVTLLQA